MQVADQDSAPIAGELVTETRAYDGGRRVTAYRPPDPPTAIVFCGDGQLVPRWAGALEAAGTPSAMLVGVHRAADEERRLFEHLKGMLDTDGRFLIFDSAWSLERARFNAKVERQQRRLNDGNAFEIFKRYIDRQDIDAWNTK